MARLDTLKAIRLARANTLALLGDTNAQSQGLQVFGGVVGGEGARCVLKVNVGDGVRLGLGLGGKAANSCLRLSKSLRF